MDTVTAVLIVATVLLAVALVLALLRARGGDGVERQLAELRARLDALVESQHALPRTLAEGTAEQARSLADLRERLAQLMEATQRVERVGRTVSEVEELLQVPKLRGTLGEIWLEELLRQVFPAGRYTMQHTFRSGERVDAVLRVGDRLVPVDAKFPLEACRRMLAETGDAADRERRAFRRTLRERIDEIADKYIRPDEGTYEFALMYIPAEAVYYEAVVRDDDPAGEESTVAYALGRRVIPVSPNTFYAYLSAVLHGLRGLEVERRAREILDGLGGVAQQLDRFGRAHDLVGRHLDHALKAHDEARRQLAAIDGQLAGMRGLGSGEGRSSQ